jgi:F420-non-reducing hydrogenase iron-sulfur subunit
MCSGRIDPTFVMKAFRNGVDGVLMCGCHPGDCHYQSGNMKCLKRYHVLREYLNQMGVEKDRLRLAWISASEGKQFAELANDFRVTLKELGPSKVKEILAPTK